MLSMEERQREVDYWRGKQDAREAMRRFADAPPEPRQPPPLLTTPYTGPFIDDPYEKYYDKHK